jgi:hypothetical protein
MSKNFALKGLRTLNGLRTLGLSVIAGVAIAAAPDISIAATHGGGGGGYHGGGGGAVGHYAGRGGYGGGGYRGYYGRGYYGGYRGYYGGYYGYRGWGYGGCCWWGWPTGLFLASLPLYYSTWWYNGVPYYYADDSYYVWDGPSSRYQQVAPPTGLLTSGAPSPTGGAPGNGAAAGELFAYPKNGQSNEQQARDRQECRAWAASQQGGAGATGAIAAATPQNAEADMRAQTACLEGRGYTVR